MDDPGSVTLWIDAARAGDELAARQLFDRYAPPLERASREQVVPRLRVAADGGEAAADALCSVLLGLRSGRFPDVRNRAALWRMLAVIARRRTIGLVRAAKRQARGGHLRQVDGAVLASRPSPSDGPDAQPIADDVRARIFERLGDEALREVARLRIEGLDPEQIAAELGCARRTVFRKLARIRTILAETEEGGAR